MPNWKLTISYDGTNYHGWQVQPDESTVQGTIQDMLGLLFDRPIKITGASRTDAGVHALGQVANVDLPDKFETADLKFRLNRMLPGDIAIKKIKKVADDFSARFSAKGKLYEYKIIDHKDPLLRDFALNIERELDFEKLNGLASHIIGRHDFSAFSIKKSIPDNAFCEIFAAEWKKTDEIVVFSVRGNRFLHEMIRALVGAMLDCERGRFEPSGFADMIDSGRRQFDYKVADPRGLFLVELFY